MSNDDKKFCIKCKEKEPPEETVLEPGVNITEARFKRSDYTCNDCAHKREQYYREKQTNEKFGEYLRQLKDETIEEFTTQWNDIAYKHVRELADKVRKVWDKYDRRDPTKGIRKDWICEVIFDNLWFIDANGIVDDFLNEMNKTRSQKLTAKPYLLEFVSNHKILGLLQESYKDKARNKWKGIVSSLLKKYEGRDKIVASPPHIDPYTKESIDNWYLLSHEKEQEMRARTREAKKKRADTITNNEKVLVKKLVEKKRHKVNNPDKENESDQ